MFGRAVAKFERLRASKLADVGPSLVELGPNMLESGPNLHMFFPARPTPARNQPTCRLRRNCDDVERPLVKPQRPALASLFAHPAAWSPRSRGSMAPRRRPLRPEGSRRAPLQDLHAATQPRRAENSPAPQHGPCNVDAHYQGTVSTTPPAVPSSSHLERAAQKSQRKGPMPKRAHRTLYFVPEAVALIPHEGAGARQPPWGLAQGIGGHGRRIRRQRRPRKGRVATRFLQEEKLERAAISTQAHRRATTPVRASRLGQCSTLSELRPHNRQTRSC